LSSNRRPARNDKQGNNPKPRPPRAIPDYVSNGVTPFNVDPAMFDKSAIKRHIEIQKQNLPHLYHPGIKFYKWARDFFECKNRVSILVAGNQLGKALDVDTEIPTPQGTFVTFTVNWPQTNSTDLVFTTSGATTIRALVGRYE
jgi:hypothetical protein